MTWPVSLQRNGTRGSTRSASTSTDDVPVNLERGEVTDLVHFWRNALGLSHWQIVEVIDDPNEHDIREDGAQALMSVNRHSKYDDAILYIHPWVVGEKDPPIQCLEERLASKSFFEYKIVHELLHLVLRDLVFVFNDALDGQLHRDVFSMFNDATDLEEEKMVDHLARSLQNAFGKFREE